MIIKYITHFDNKEQSDKFMELIYPLLKAVGISIERKDDNTFLFEINKYQSQDLLVDFGSILGMAEVQAKMCKISHFNVKNE